MARAIDHPCNFFSEGRANAMVASLLIVDDNENVSVLKKDAINKMTPQPRWPDLSTSVSGITPEDWDRFKNRARLDGVKYRDALEMAIVDLAAAIRRGDKIDWQPSRSAPSRAVRMHADTRDLINDLVKESGYKQNVIVGTAMDYWISRP
jgi:hypothetical protein